MSGGGTAICPCPPTKRFANCTREASQRSNRSCRPAKKQFCNRSARIDPPRPNCRRSRTIGRRTPIVGRNSSRCSSSSAAKRSLLAISTTLNEQLVSCPRLQTQKTLRRSFPASVGQRSMYRRCVRRTSLPTSTSLSCPANLRWPRTRPCGSPINTCRCAHCFFCANTWFSSYRPTRSWITCTRRTTASPPPMLASPFSHAPIRRVHFRPVENRGHRAVARNRAHGPRSLVVCFLEQ